jgi:hypothetical protein
MPRNVRAGPGISITLPTIASEDFSPRTEWLSARYGSAAALQAALISTFTDNG